ncbi:hypothetical protein A1D31_22605 [Bradyrhizobium liaoningense]|nr:hypothetical protein A1D31_22605 [Bradyrhizobium liaoningense]
MSATQRAAKLLAAKGRNGGESEGGLQEARSSVRDEMFKPRAPGRVVIKPANMQTAILTIEGESPLVINAFSQKAMDSIIETQLAGSQSRKGKKREPKDFDAAYQGAMHISREGWLGINASAFRNAAISACRVCGFKMTIAKLSLFVIADGYDRVDNLPLVRITKGEPIRHTMHARPKTGGVDIRVRPMWLEGWQAKLNMRWDADQFSADDVFNLLSRVGMQVGIGEGRYDSKDSAGLGWGCFKVLGGGSDVEAAA